MSVLSVGGRRFAAGLYWLERGGAASVVRTARRFARPYYVHRGRQTGYAPGGEESPEGCPSLAASLQAHLGTEFWMALVESDDGCAALVKVREGAILADGDEVFEDRAAAVEAFERARGLGWSLHATPGSVEGEAAALDVSALPVESDMRLARAPFARLGGAKAAGAGLLLAAVAGGAALWMHREAVRAWFAAPEPVAERVRAAVEPAVAAVVDGAAFIEACRRALRAHPPYLPAWRLERVRCEARFADAALVAVRPELEGRAVLLVRWRLAPGYAQALHRRIAERHLAGWHAASVVGADAWAVVPLDPVLRARDAAPPPFLALRRAVDRRFGALGARIEYPRGEGRTDGVEVRIGTDLPLARVADLAGDVEGFEILRVRRDGGGGWRVEGRRAAPVEVPRSRFEALTRRLDDGGTTPDA